ncbi:MAG TPA: PilZ domain-containing protein [Thermoanaerobaculia bacterium]|nr:PilZ domain-containing protein [Thermoanaerobaculia bacterium]
MERDLRTVPRYFLTPPLHGNVDGNPARILDLSSKGARLEMVNPLESGKQYYLEIPTGITVPITALWSELDTIDMEMIHDTYLIGVSFDRPSRVVSALLDDLLGREAAMRIEDFRSCDRYRITAPITATFGDSTPVSLLDLSLRGARISAESRIGVGSREQLRFQIDGESGPIDVAGRVVWTTAGQQPNEFLAGIVIVGQDEKMREVIHSLCVSGEARIDLDSLRRKFDGLRERGRAAGRSAVARP